MSYIDVKVKNADNADLTDFDATPFFKHWMQEAFNEYAKMIISYYLTDEDALPRAFISETSPLEIRIDLFGNLIDCPNITINLRNITVSRLEFGHKDENDFGKEIATALRQLASEIDDLIKQSPA